MTVVEDAGMMVSTAHFCVRSHHLVLRLGVDVHHARMAVGDSLAVMVFVEKGLHCPRHLLGAQRILVGMKVFGRNYEM